MTLPHIAEVALAVLLLVAGIYLYRKGAREDASQGAQGAVLLFVIAAILAIHGLGLMNYHPTSYEIEASRR